MKLKRLGFFYESNVADPFAPSIHLFVRPACGTNEERLAQYIEAGEPLLISAGGEDDVIDPAGGFAGTPDILTDGEWARPRTLAYYLRRYHLALPEEFLRHVAGKGWSPPGRVNLAELEL